MILGLRSCVGFGRARRGDWVSFGDPWCALVG